MATTTTPPSESDPWAWLAYQQQQDPNGVNAWKDYGGTNTYLQSAVDSGIIDPATYAQEQAQVNAASDVGTGTGWQTVTDKNGNQQLVPLDALSRLGYTARIARGPGYMQLSQLVDPKGNVADKTGYATTDSLHRNAYANMLAVLSGGLGAGSALGAAGYGAGAGITGTAVGDALAAAQAAQGGGALGAAATGAELGAVGGQLASGNTSGTLKGAALGGIGGLASDYLNGAITTDAQTLYSNAGYGETLTPAEITQFDEMLATGMTPEQAAQVIYNPDAATPTGIASLQTPVATTTAPPEPLTDKTGYDYGVDNSPDMTFPGDGSVPESPTGLQTAQQTPGTTQNGNVPNDNPNAQQVVISGSKIDPPVTPPATVTPPVVPPVTGDPNYSHEGDHNPPSTNNPDYSHEGNNPNPATNPPPGTDWAAWLKNPANLKLLLQGAGLLTTLTSKGNSASPGGWTGTDQSTMTSVPATGMQRTYVPPPAGYRPGFDPEWNYFQYTPAANLSPGSVPSTTADPANPVVTPGTNTPGTTMPVVEPASASTQGIKRALGIQSVATQPVFSSNSAIGASPMTNQNPTFSMVGAGQAAPVDTTSGAPVAPAIDPVKAAMAKAYEAHLGFDGGSSGTGAQEWIDRLTNNENLFKQYGANSHDNIFAQNPAAYAAWQAGNADAFKAALGGNNAYSSDTDRYLQGMGMDRNNMTPAQIAAATAPATATGIAPFISGGVQAKA